MSPYPALQPNNATISGQSAWSFTTTSIGDAGTDFILAFGGLIFGALLGFVVFQLTKKCIKGALRRLGYNWAPEMLNWNAGLSVRGRRWLNWRALVS
jgi:hypothetical protein